MTTSWVPTAARVCIIGLLDQPEITFSMKGSKLEWNSPMYDGSTCLHHKFTWTTWDNIFYERIKIGMKFFNVWRQHVSTSYDGCTYVHVWLHIMTLASCIVVPITHITSITAAAIITHIDGLVEKLDVYCSIIKIIMMNGFVPQIFVPHEWRDLGVHGDEVFHLERGELQSKT